MINKAIVQYIRDENRNPKGVVVAIKTDENNEIRIGFSKYNEVSETKPFDKELALQIAFGRAEKYSIQEILEKASRAKHSSIQHTVNQVLIRSVKYFKDGKTGLQPEITETLRKSTYENQ